MAPTLIEQIKKVVPEHELASFHSDACTTDEEGEDPMSRDDALQELLRLQENIGGADGEDNEMAPESEAGGATGPAPVPACVPELPPKMMWTKDMQELKRLALSTDKKELEKPRIGFFGAGGIGKTVCSSAIIRDDDIRRHFEKVLWVTIGQTPVFKKLLAQQYVQLTGKELSNELSKVEQRAEVELAMRGKRVLLVLDDLVSCASPPPPPPPAQKQQQRHHQQRQLGILQGAGSALQRAAAAAASCSVLALTPRRWLYSLCSGMATRRTNST